ncbi:MAG: class I poly(R)-hydroxyalkanoic acid synthase [Alcaligenaceae bacterium]|nr:class I poly(R)-hydroxyalkanoic acid synthase [Alcaligenaceae bacterium]
MGLHMNSTFPEGLVLPPGISKEAITSIQQDFLQAWQRLSQEATQGHLPALKDRRFAAPAWASSPPHLLMAHLYLLSTEAMQKMVEASDASAELKERLHFSVMQWVEAMSPANFLATNPDAQAAVIDSGGQTLVAGVVNLMGDLQKGRITQSDESQFVVGTNVATSVGSVVFQNKFFQLLQYSPTTPTVFQRPLILVPPCINKFYILDLQPENSFVLDALAQGFTVYLMSWRNPLADDTDGFEKATWDEYLTDGILTALKVTQEISGQSQINALGFCVGGTLLAAGLAVAAAKGENPVASLTLLTSMVDFKETGPLGVFVDEQHASLREQQIGHGGLMSARELGTTFSFLRPNELVWNYVVSNYLKGESPVAFDLLFWNSDSTNLPGPFFTWYFRHTYLENKLSQPNALTCCGVPLDLRKVKVPTYLYGSREDHIVPWHSAFASAAIFPGPNRFVLGASGHIAGVINPPAKHKRHYWVAEQPVNGQTAEQWFAEASQCSGSWWPDWNNWLASHSGERVKASKKLGNKAYPVLEAAPGSYVKVRAV